MWMVDPRLMCNNHLNGEHNELHKLVGVIRNHPHGIEIAEGQGEKGNIDTSLIADRHEALVDEMERRGWNHNSPLDYEDNLDLGEVSKANNRRELSGRCDECNVS